jgi:outer membrane protein assembly factor BamB
MGKRGNDEVVLALDQEDGKEVWSSPVGPSQTRFSHAEPKSTPTVDGELLFAVGMNGSIICLETATGKLRWRKEYASDFGGRMMSDWGYSESPLVDGDRVVCTPGGDQAALVALNKKTGQVIWKAAVPQSGGAGYSSIVIAEVGGIRQYVTLLGQSAGVVGVSAKDGKLLWRYNRVANGTANIPTPIVRGDLIFCSTGYGAGAALLKLVPSGGGIKFEEKYFLNANEFQNHHGGMVLVGDHVYAGSGHNNGLPTCIELRTGKIKWGKQRGPGSESAAVVCADGHLYFRYQDAVMALIEANPAGYRLKGSFRIPNGATPSWSHPVVAGGRLYLRDQDRLLCYDVKAPSDVTTSQQKRR